MKFINFVAVYFSILVSGCSDSNNNETPIDDPMDDTDKELPLDVATRLEQVIDIVNANAIEIPVQAMIEVSQIHRRDYTDSVFTVTGSSFGVLFGEENIEFDCLDGGDGGGSINELAAPEVPVGFGFSDCQVSDLLLDGRVLGREDQFISGLFLRYTFEEFRVNDPSADSDTMIGRIRYQASDRTGYDIRSFTEPASSIPQLTVKRQNYEYQVTYLQLISENIDVLLDDVRPGFTAEFEAILEPNAETTIVSTLEPFESNLSDGSRNTGSLQISGSNYDYTLLASNGDPDTFQLTVQEGEVTNSYTVSWSSNFSLEAFDTSSVDLGFNR